MKLFLMVFLPLVLAACATQRQMPSNQFSSGPCPKFGQHLKSADLEANKFQDPLMAYKDITDCLKTTTNNPLKVLLLNLRSIIHEQLNDLPNAIKDKEAQVEISPPKTAWDVIGIARLYRENGENEKALALFQDMFEKRLGVSGKGTTPGMPSYYHYGQTLLNLKRYPEAIEAFTEGLTYQPDYGWAMYFRAIAYDGSNKIDLAKNDLEKAQMLIVKTYKSKYRDSYTKTFNKDADFLKKYEMDILSRLKDE